MDMSTTNATTVTASVKTPEAENETPARIQSAKVGGFSNGVLKRHLPLHLHGGGYHNHGGAFNGSLHSPPAMVVTYKECLKNHAASLGGHAVDGCGEFMPSPACTSTDPTSLKCAACGCHRNFHRREPEELVPPPALTPSLEYQPHHRHHPPPPPAAAPANRNSGGHSSPSSPSPPPISSSYYPSAPHMLLALSAGLTAPPSDNNTSIPITPTAVNPAGIPGSNSNGRKRFRTKFTADQKGKMHEFADRIGWRIQKRDEDLIESFCNSIGVDKSVLKVWMHNNKNHFGRKDSSNSTPGSGTGGIPPANSTPEHGHGNGNGNGLEFTIHYHHNGMEDSKNGIHPHELGHHQIHHHRDAVTNGNGNASSCSS